MKFDYKWSFTVNNDVLMYVCVQMVSFKDYINFTLFLNDTYVLSGGRTGL
jgi:hypothetical protein